MKGDDAMSNSKQSTDENLLVQKSRPLFSLWKEKEKVNLFEYKMLDKYLSKINSHNPDKRTVSFSLEDINELMGAHISKSELHERLKKLQSLVVSYNEDEGVTLFEYSKINIDDNHFDVQLMCTQTAHKYFFNIETVGYFKYKFRNILELTSMYSYILFNYLEMNRFRKQPFEIELSELKKILGCESCSEFKYFNRDVLKKCYEEITEKTELKYTYEPVKVSRTVQRIRFNVLKSKQLEDMYERDVIEQELSPDEIGLPLDEKVAINGNFTYKQDYDVVGEFDESAFYTDETEEDSEYNRRMDLFSECFDETFTKDEVNLILTAVNPECVKESQYGQDVAKCDYLYFMYRKLKVEEKNRKIYNRLKYFVSMLENDKPKD